ncbi:MAG TPA: CpsD/CapB family tyrosine-protein kinase [Clostridiaceae bacterium]|nr:CpsD/CapB family tyrosine-protein kinase [Clostridiaceae bacterium]
MIKNKQYPNSKHYYSAYVEESYRALRTNIQFCCVDKQIKTLAVTSCNPEEGKTTTAINLAIFNAKAGSNVLLVDCDLRKPAIAKRFGIRNPLGLTNFITGHATLDKVANETSIPNLSVISCGPIPPNPSELLTSKMFTSFLSNMEEFYDIIIIDTPPLGAIIDAAIISSKTDGVILVLSSGKVDFKSAKKVISQLEQANARILGTVLNKVNKKSYGNYYSYYYYNE